MVFYFLMRKYFILYSRQRKSKNIIEVQTNKSCKSYSTIVVKIYIINPIFLSSIFLLLEIGLNNSPNIA